MVLLLMIEKIERLLKNVKGNIILKIFIPVIMICHVFSVDVHAPASAEKFNLQIMKIFTFDFGLFDEWSSPRLLFFCCFWAISTATPLLFLSIYSCAGSDYVLR